MANKRLDALRDALLTAQAQLTHGKAFALSIIVTGVPTAGRSEVVNRFLTWLDQKRIHVYALNDLRREPDDWPPMRRYWLTLPARGEIAFYFLGWYEDYFAPAMHAPKKAKRDEARVIARIKQLETMLYHDRVRVLKLDLRVDRKTQKQRLAVLRSDKATRWRVTREDRWLAKHYDRWRKAMDRVIEATDQPNARWHVIDGADPDKRTLAAGSLVLKELQRGARTASQPAARVKWSAPVAAPKKALFPTAGAELDDAAYERELGELQRKFALLTRKRAFEKRGAVFAFEGMDAAGKGGAIQRLTAPLDARQYTVIPVSAPTPEELAHPYLWRFWRNVPERGEIAVFDRSWYGRVLVERVRDLTPVADWQRAYDEINEFERQLVEARLIVHKFWLSVSKNEQLQRFKDREHEPLKRFKVDKEDWANRRYYDEYQVAAREMIARTSTEHAPWTVVEADDKRFARLVVLRAVCDAIEKQL